ncbi:hypothetical protein HPQ64_12685 [Rhizobiales bacterium]|uniref:hypothetical protein n=1 Tax=Hongsoonwoonella zoysiae TaxID=2821844 RepID=UPI00155F72FA|nr:hypothetical protein [Hongsoonwoonella zoysiae]NRG18546.1 hypothetical protein [Hongsoonwoonella zoysiae]
MNSLKPHAAFFFALGFPVALAGCSTSNSSTPTSPVVRTSEATAPAALQLTCASEAATRFDVSSDKILPVSSRPGGDGGYLVDLSMDGQQATCAIGEDGVVTSLERA